LQCLAFKVRANFTYMIPDCQALAQLRSNLIPTHLRASQPYHCEIFP